MIRRAEGKGLRIAPPGRDIRCNATSPWDENPHHRGRRKAPGDFLLTQMNATSMYQHDLQSSEPVAYDPRTANTIHPGHWSTASVFSGLNWSEVETTSGEQPSYFPPLSSAHGHWRRNAPQTLRAKCVVSGGVLVVGYGESLA